MMEIAAEPALMGTQENDLTIFLNAQKIFTPPFSFVLPAWCERAYI